MNMYIMPFIIIVGPNLAWIMMIHAKLHLFLIFCLCMFEFLLQTEILDMSNNIHWNCRHFDLICWMLCAIVVREWGNGAIIFAWWHCLWTIKCENSLLLKKEKHISLKCWKLYFPNSIVFTCILGTIHSVLTMAFWNELLFNFRLVALNEWVFFLLLLSVN